MTMKLRNRLIALVCLLIFLTLGGLILLSTSQRKPFAVILFVTDNLTPSSLTAARFFSGGADARLQLEEFPNAALCRNAAADFSVPDSASASTQIAGGKRVSGNSLCIDASGTKLPSLLEIAATRGRATGLITTGNVAAPTSAAYFAKTPDAGNRADMVGQYANHQPFDLLAGGGSEDFDPSADAMKGNDSGAGEPVLKKMKDKGVVVVRSLNDLESHSFSKKAPLLALLSTGPLAFGRTGDPNQDPSSLAELVRIAIRHLESNSRGYLLVVDDPMIAAAATANDGEAMLHRIIAFDQAVATARHYAGEKATILVTGRENIGGMQLNGYPFLRDKGVAVLALNAQGIPSLCWSSGPGYSVEKSDAGISKKNSSSGILSQPSAIPLPSAVGTAGDVLSLGIGPGSERLRGFLDLTEIHKVISNEL